MAKRQRTRPEIAPCPIGLSHAWRKPHYRRKLGRAANGPKDGIEQHALIARVSPDRLLMSQRGVKHTAPSIGPRPRQRPAVGASMHVAPRDVHGCFVQAQE